MARPKGARKLKEETQDGFRLLEALQFISIAQSDIGDPLSTHCTIAQKEIVGFNGILAAGFPVDEDISACPHTATFLKSLKGRPTDGLSITQLDSSLVVSCPPFRSVVPLVEFGTIGYARPDPMVAPATDALRVALAIVAPIVAENNQNAALTAIGTMNGSVVATDSTVALEAVHGISFPPGLVIPKRAAEALAKTKYKIIGFGFTPQSSLTVHFDNGAWFKTQLYPIEYVNVYPQLEKPTNYSPIPQGLFQSINGVATLATEYLYFEDNTVRTQKSKDVGASFTSFGLPHKRCFNFKKLCVMEPLASHVDFTSEPDRVKFAGTVSGLSVRGVIMGCAWLEDPILRQIAPLPNGIPPGAPMADSLDDEIPF